MNETKEAAARHDFETALERLRAVVRAIDTENALLEPRPECLAELGWRYNLAVDEYRRAHAAVLTEGRRGVARCIQPKGHPGGHVFSAATANGGEIYEPCNVFEEEVKK